MKIKTSELQGAALDWAVAKCEGHGDSWLSWHLSEPPWDQSVENRSSCCGPILDREKMLVGHWTTGVWVARQNGAYLVKEDGNFKPVNGACGFGTTPLIATMRCYVVSKLGDEVDVPDELL